MRVKDTTDVLTSCVAVLADAAAVFAGFMLATWLRFDSGLVPLFHDFPPPNLYTIYASGALVATLVMLFIFQALGLYIRPQTGMFGDRIPRLSRATLLGMLLTVALAFAIRTDPPFSRVTALLALATVFLAVLTERYALFHWEIRLARRQEAHNRVAILGTDWVAGRLRQALQHEPRLHSRVVGFFASGPDTPHESVRPDDIRGGLDALECLLDARGVDQVIVTDTSLGSAAMIRLILRCEQALVSVSVVPDLFRVLTADVDMHTIADIPILGVGRWPLDHFWNRALKRLEDVMGAIFGLALLAIPFAVIAWLIRRDSPGPAFYSQERCGEGGRPFRLFKFRTMRQDAEADGTPGWTVADDPRRTRIGRFLRRWNLDELPQLWNVLKGDMSLVGPRPERPHFVQQFKEDIQGYMWRHVSKPGLTGWAQVNGLRGNTDIRERSRYDLYYLENWSLAFDFKILVKTLFAHTNAY
jgi:exopolysaccharide biosynthesis polyprenyl glycosylphosphotransferase